MFRKRQNIRRPVNDIAKELGNIRVANMVMLGAYLALSPLFEDEVIHSVLATFGREKGKHARSNVEAVDGNAHTGAGMITDFNALLTNASFPASGLSSGGEDEAAACRKARRRYRTREP